MSKTSSSDSRCSSSSWEAVEEGEFEVARVLASLAVVEENGRGGGGSRGGGEWECGNYDWMNKGKRTNKRVKFGFDIDNHARSSDLGSGSGSGSCSMPLPFDLNIVDQAAMYDQEERENIGEGVEVNVAESHESTDAGHISNQAHSGSRRRQNLTESEKEARRIHRILANRESARQTIRRRQALYEELTREAADLVTENENLKKSKDFAAKDFQCLQNTNKNLKEEISQMLGFDLGQNQEGSSRSSDANTCNILPSNWPFLVCNSISTNSFIWPTCIQMQPSIDLELQRCMTSLPKAGVTTHINPCLLHKHENSQNIDGQNKPLCVLTCPWFLPLSSMKNNDSIFQLSSVHLNDKDEIVVDAKHVPSPTSILNRPSVLMQYVHTLGQGKCKNGVIEAQLGCSTNPLLDTGASSGISFQIGGALTGIERVVHFCKNKVDAVAGADARKRRKELMKLKSIHCHPTRGGYG